MKQYDVIIVGGGLVGASCALALDKLKLKVALIDKYPIKSPPPASFDSRSIAIAPPTINFFNNLNLWHSLESLATPIKAIHVSKKNCFGRTLLKPQDKDYLGYVISANSIGQEVYNKLDSSKISCYFGNDITQLEFFDNLWQLKVKEKISGTLLIGADGAKSIIKEQLGIKDEIIDYNQTAVIANVLLKQSHNNVAYERFYNESPMALLPFTNNMSSLIWAVPNAKFTAIKNLTDNNFLHELQSTFGYRLGKFLQISKRNYYPLKQIKAKQTIKNQMILLGNASLSLHPIAGQSYNLSIREIANLLQTIIESGNNNFASEANLTKFEELCKRDRENTIFFINKLITLFTFKLPLANLSQSFSLTLADNLGLLNNYVKNLASGKHSAHADFCNFEV